MSRIEEFKLETLGVPGSQFQRTSRRVVRPDAQGEPSPPMPSKVRHLQRGASLKSTERTGTSGRTGG